MNFPSAGRLRFLPSAVNAIRIPPEWVIDHAVLIECPLESLELEEFSGDGDEDLAFEVVFEPDFNLDDEEDEDGGSQDAAALSDQILALLDDDEDDDEEEEEENWPS